MIEATLARLPERVRYYALAIDAGDEWMEAHNRLELGVLVGSLLFDHLRAASSWDADAWLDAVVPSSVEVSANGATVLSGVALWRGQTGAFVEPLAATFELSSDGVSVRAYSLRFGDAERGIGAMRHDGLLAAAAPARPVRWCLEFGEAR